MKFLESVYKNVTLLERCRRISIWQRTGNYRGRFYKMNVGMILVHDTSAQEITVKNWKTPHAVARIRLFASRIDGKFEVVVQYCGFQVYTNLTKERPRKRSYGAALYRRLPKRSISERTSCTRKYWPRMELSVTCGSFLHFNVPYCIWTKPCTSPETILLKFKGGINQERTTRSLCEVNIRYRLKSLALLEFIVFKRYVPLPSPRSCCCARDRNMSFMGRVELSECWLF